MSDRFSSLEQTLASAFSPPHQSLPSFANLYLLSLVDELSSKLGVLSGLKIESSPFLTSLSQFSLPTVPTA